MRAHDLSNCLRANASMTRARFIHTLFVRRVRALYIEMLSRLRTALSAAMGTEKTSTGFKVAAWVRPASCRR